MLSGGRCKNNFQFIFIVKYLKLDIFLGTLLILGDAEEKVVTDVSCVFLSEKKNLFFFIFVKNSSVQGSSHIPISVDDF